MENMTFTRPVDSRLEHVDFSLLFSTLSISKIIKLFSSLLMERRVIFCTSSLSLMTGCAHALMALLYPFEWQVSERECECIRAGVEWAWFKAGTICNIVLIA